MPQIPYSPVATVNPTGAPGAFIQTSGDSGAGLVGEALSKAGASMARDADRLQDTSLKIAALNNDSEAKEADVKFSMDSSNLLTEFSTLSDEDKIKKLPEYQQKLMELRETHLGGLSNPAVRRAAQGSMGHQAALTFSAMGRGVVSATVQRNQAAGKARADDLADRALKAEDDDFDEFYKGSLNEVKDTSMKAVGDEKVAAQAMQQKSDQILSNRIEQFSYKDPERARGILEKYGDKISEPVRAKLDQAIQRDETRIGAKKIADDVISGSGTDDDYARATAKKESSNGKKLAPDDPTQSASGLYGFTEGTYNGLKKNHPELELPAFQRGLRNVPEEKQTALLKAFTEDNKKFLPEGVEASGKNMRIMHFMGSGDGPKFLKAVRDNPDAPAAVSFPAAADANGNVFFTKNGTARSVKEVYDLQTAGFSGAPLGGDSKGLKPLTPQSTEADIGAAAKEARKRAEAMYPDNIEAANAAEQNVRTRGASVLAEAKLRQRQNFQYLMTNVMIPKDGKPLPTSLDEVFADPGNRQAYNAMDPDKMLDVQKALERNVRKNRGEDPQPNPERLKRYAELRGLAVNDPEKFKSEVLGKEDLPKAWMNKLYELWAKPAKPEKEGDDMALSTVLGKLSKFGLQEKAGVFKSNPQRYNTWVGSVANRLEAAQEKGEVWDDKKILEVGRQLSDDVDTGQRGMFGGKKTAKGYTLPAPTSSTPTPARTVPEASMPHPLVTEQITQQYIQKNPGKTPTADEVKEFYTKNKPAWDTWLKGRQKNG